MKPQAHVLRPRCFRSDLVSRIFNIDPVFLQVRQCLAQDRHARNMKGNVIKRLWGWLSLEECDRDVVVANRDTAVEFELLAQAEHALKPARTLFWIAHGESEMSDFAKVK